MGLFGRRSEALHERLRREAGLDVDPDATREDTPPPGAVIDPFAWGFADAESRAATPRPREWDATVTVEAPGIDGDTVTFTAVDGETLIVDDEGRHGNLTPLADAVERRLQPPYEARATRQRGDLWAVAARKIEIVRLEADGDAIDVVRRDGERDATVDGDATGRSFPALEALGERAGGDYAVHAERLEGDLWQARVAAL